VEVSPTSQRRTLERCLTATVAESKRIRHEIGERETRDDLRDLRLAMALCRGLSADLNAVRH
jgi:hypothetical protein